MIFACVASRSAAPEVHLAGHPQYITVSLVFNYF